MKLHLPKPPPESPYARARAHAALLVAEWEVAPCLCCWLPPWRHEDDPAVDEDIALEEIGYDPMRALPLIRRRPK